MIDNWREISSFPGYSVSSGGHVRNDETDRIMRLGINGHGVVNVGLMRQGIQCKRAVSLLVAQAHLPRPRFETFGSTINLDGDRTNNRASNLEWRPRWFATQYFQQFKSEPLPPLGPVEEMNTGEEFETTWAAALKYGLVDFSIRLAMKAHQPVWPTYHMFLKI